MDPTTLLLFERRRRWTAGFAWVAFALAAGTVMAQDTQKQKIIFDTDTAFFLDDGAALVMLLERQDKVDILGVTTVSGNLWARQGSEYMLHTLELTGNGHIPLYIGAQLPLVNTAERARIQREHYGGLTYIGAFDDPVIRTDADLEPPHGGQFAEARPQKKDAVSFLIETLDANPGEVTILALGPLTNIAMALNLRPDLAAKIQSLVFMGGALRVPGNTSPYAEFNFWFDPEAAQQVLRSEIPEKVMFGLDITNKAPFTKAQFDAMVAKDTPVTRLLAADGKETWGFYQDPPRSSFIWDCLAAGWLIDPTFVTEEETVPVDVEAQLGSAYGASYEPSGESPEGLLPTRVMLDLDYDKFMAMYQDLLTRAR